MKIGRFSKTCTMSSRTPELVPFATAMRDLYAYCSLCEPPKTPFLLSISYNIYPVYLPSAPFIDLQCHVLHPNAMSYIPILFPTCRCNILHPNVMSSIPILYLTSHKRNPKSDPSRRDHLSARNRHSCLTRNVYEEDFHQHPSSLQS